jgi:glycosyltransferase involved in cell wall biosynthesis
VKILYTVQRYGGDIVGGSESACRDFATRLAGRGHDVEVVTSCARNYTDWANELEPGTSDLDGVTVHRLPVIAERRAEDFDPINGWTIYGPWPIPLAQQDRWARLSGPQMEGYRRWLVEHSARFDVVVHMTYLYASTTYGITVTSGRVPTVLQPTAHAEPALWVRRFDTTFRLADGFLFFTEEERDLVARRFWLDPCGPVTGIGIDIAEPGDGPAFRQRWGLGSAPYLCYLGRLDPSKGVAELIRFFTEYKRRNPGPLRLVLAGDAETPDMQHPDVTHVGFLREDDKRAALAGCLALAQPSYFESFSIVLCEAWAQGRPALVQAHSPVLAGQARRSQGALPYGGYAAFEAALDRLVDDPATADRLGRAGRSYVERRYAWSTVLDQIEDGLTSARSRAQTRRS